MQRPVHQAANSEQDEYAQLSLVQAADHLGISRKKTIQLAKSGLIPVEPRASPRSGTKWRFRKDHLDTSLEEALKHLQMAPLPSQTEQRILTLAEAVNAIGFHRVRWIDLVNAIVEGDLTAQREPDTQGLKGIWLYAEDLDSFRERRRFPDGIVLHPIYTVMEVLRCGKKTLDHLASSGLLVPVRGYPSERENQWFYDRQDISAFQERYITSDIAASIIGCSRQSLLKCVARGWITAVSGPRIDGARIYRFEKQAAIRWRQERLTSSEARTLLGVSQRTIENWVAEGKLKPLRVMMQHVHWFAREDIEGIKAVRMMAADKQIPKEFYNARISKRQFRLTEQQAKDLLVAQANCEDQQTRKRFQAVRLYGMGHSYGKVMETVECSRTTLCIWCRKYQQQGVQGLLDKRFKDCKSAKPVREQNK